MRREIKGRQHGEVSLHSDVMFNCNSMSQVIFYHEGITILRVKY